jgi:hypothetical protein
MIRAIIIKVNNLIKSWEGGERDGRGVSNFGQPLMKVALSLKDPQQNPTESGVWLARADSGSEQLCR